MTWAEFKAAVESLGIRDADRLAYIDVELLHSPDPLRRVPCDDGTIGLEQ